MKNIKIATLWDARNFGAFLQAYALSSFLKARGFEVAFIKEKKDKVTFPLKSFIRSFLVRLGVFGVKSKYQYLQDKKITDYHSKFSFCESENKSFATVVGSDEIWNISSPYFPHLPIYFGEGANSDVVISYAASSNTSTKEDFIRIIGDNPFARFNHISVRDRYTKQVVESFLLGKESKLVLDPTFLLDDYDDILIPTKLDNYLFVYGYGFSEEEQSIIKFAAEKKHLKIVSAGPYLEWTDIQIPASPGEFLGLVKGADFVMTSTFHGTVFSIILQKQFASFCRDNNKVFDILDNLCLSSRNCSLKDVSTMLEEPINYNVIKEKLFSLRDSSIKFLLKALD
jgi:hypothetical protein